MQFSIYKLRLWFKEVLYARLLCGRTVELVHEIPCYETRSSLFHNRSARTNERPRCESRGFIYVMLVMVSEASPALFNICKTQENNRRG